jgi:hypothetical protein
MPTDYSKLDAAIADAAANATQIEGAADSVVVILQSVADQIVAALTADNAIDQANTDRAVADVKAVIVRNQASAQKIADAIAANTPPTPVP